MRGGRCSTKTWGAAEAIVYYTRKYKTRVICAREIKERIDSTTRQVVVDTIYRYGIEDEYEILAKSITHLVTGSVITFQGLNPSDPESLKGFEGVNILWLDEAENVSAETMKVLSNSIRGGKKGSMGAQIWLTWNPASPASWVAKTFMSGTLPPNTLIEELNYLEVLDYIPQALIDDAEHMRKTDYDSYCHVWLGEFRIEGSTALFKAMELQEAFNKRIPDVIDRSDRVMLGIDPSGTGQDDNLYIVRQGKRVLYYHEVKTATDKLRVELARTLMIKYNVNFTVVDCGGGYGDGIVSGLRDLGFRNIVRFMSGYKPSKITVLNARAEVYSDMNEWVKEGGCFGNLPDKARTRLLTEMTGIKVKVDNKGKLALISKKEMADSPDAADALSLTFFKNGLVDVEATRQMAEMFE